MWRLGGDQGESWIWGGRGGFRLGELALQPAGTRPPEQCLQNSRLSCLPTVAMVGKPGRLSGLSAGDLHPLLQADIKR